jgi:hypothetical protein
MDLDLGRTAWVDKILEFLDQYLGAFESSVLVMRARQNGLEVPVIDSIPPPSPSVYLDSIDVHNQTQSAVAESFLAETTPALDEEEEVEDLGDRLKRLSLPGLTSVEQIKLLAIVNTMNKVHEHGHSMDALSTRFIQKMHLQNFAARISTGTAATDSMKFKEFSMAFHSDSQVHLVKFCQQFYGDKIRWKEASTIGLGYWIQSIQLLRSAVETMARNQYMYPVRGDCMNRIMAWLIQIV